MFCRKSLRKTSRTVRYYFPHGTVLLPHRYGNGSLQVRCNFPWGTLTLPQRYGIFSPAVRYPLGPPKRFFPSGTVISGMCGRRRNAYFPSSTVFGPTSRAYQPPAKRPDARETPPDPQRRWCFAAPTDGRAPHARPTCPLRPGIPRTTAILRWTHPQPQQASTITVPVGKYTAWVPSAPFLLAWQRNGRPPRGRPSVLGGRTAPQARAETQNRRRHQSSSSASSTPRVGPIITSLARSRHGGPLVSTKIEMGATSVLVLDGDRIDV